MSDSQATDNSPGTAPDTAPTSPSQGLDADLSTPETRALALEWAFDYRGDVTLRLADDREIEGYVFDRRDGDPPTLRIMAKAGGTFTLSFDQVVGLTFTGRDTAAGKSWETWVKKYHEKRAKGEAANLPAEPLDED